MYIFHQKYYGSEWLGVSLDENACWKSFVHFSGNIIFPDIFITFHLANQWIFYNYFSHVNFFLFYYYFNIFLDIYKTLNQTISMEVFVLSVRIGWIRHPKYKLNLYLGNILEVIAFYPLFHGFE